MVGDLLKILVTILGNTYDDYVNRTDNSPKLGPWKFGNKCVDCESRSINSYHDVVPDWKVFTHLCLVLTERLRMFVLTAIENQ
jgi:hypothetical protein